MKIPAIYGLNRNMGQGILGAEILCADCNEFIDLEYDYQSHLWFSTCLHCRLGYTVDLETIINLAKEEPYRDWDKALKELV